MKETMDYRSRLIVVFALPMILLAWQSTKAQWREEEMVQESLTVLDEMMQTPAQAIPQQLLSGAEGIAIIPKVIKGGFMVGARYGRGTLLVRDNNGGWHAPVFVSITGGSFGWQVGVQSTDVILVFKTKKSIEGILTKKFTLGVDAAAAAGPIGRQASAATDVQLDAEIYSYARSRGLFLGASLDGSMLQMDGVANAAYYRSPAPGEPAAIPPSAIQLIQKVANYNATTVAPVEPLGATTPGQNQDSNVQGIVGINSLETPNQKLPQSPTLAQQYSTQESVLIREQLSKTSPGLFNQLDPAWTQFLALPAEVFSNQGDPPIEAIERSLQNYEQVITNPQYRSLAQLPAFQSTYGLLRHYLSTLSKSDRLTDLPPPPAR